ncbi:MAG: AAA family ATPase, partial [bacterium]
SPEDIFVTRELLVDQLEQVAKLAGDAVDENAKWDSLVVSDDTMSKLKQISNSLRNMEARLKQGYDPPKGAILFGPPGTGKTQIAKTLANESGVQYLLKGLTDVQAGYIGQSALKVSALFAEARSKAPCLLFIDEFDKAAASRSGDQSGSFSSDIVTQLLAEMDGAKKTGRPVFVLAATNYLEHIDDAVRSRFSYEIEIPYPTAEQRERLFAIFLSRYPRVDFDITAMAVELARRSGDVGGRDIQQLVMRASQAAAQRAEEAGTPDAIVLTRDDLLRQFAPKGAAVTEEDLQKVWSQIVLKPDVKESLLGMIRLFNAGDKAAAKGLLLYGPPGTGKTEIARLLAQSTGCKFLEVKPSDLKG